MGKVGGSMGPGMQGQGTTGGRMRNTAANLYSKNTIDYNNPGGAAALPATTPEQTANYYGQLGTLYSQYQNQLTSLKQQRVGIRAGVQQAVAGIQAQKISGLADQENAATESGLLGSSADLTHRAGVRAGAAQQIQATKQTALQGIAQTRLDAQTAALGYNQGVQGLQAQQLAQQQQALAMQLQNNLIVSGQEQQSDIMKQIYEALAGNAQHGTSGGGGKATPYSNPNVRGGPGAVERRIGTATAGTTSTEAASSMADIIEKLKNGLF